MLAVARQRGLRAQVGGVAVSLRRHLARATAWWAFRSPRAASAHLLAFAAAERNSELELLAAARLTPSDDRRASYVRHALDEGRHANAFFKRAHPDGNALFPDVDVDDLYQRLGERDFLALVFVGEARGAAQFRGYIDALGAAEPGRLFSGIIVDEDRHERDTWHHLVQVCHGDEARARQRVRAMILWMAWRRWHRAGRTMSSMLYAACMTLLFVACAPLAWWMKRTRPEPRGWAQP